MNQTRLLPLMTTICNHSRRQAIGKLHCGLTFEVHVVNQVGLDLRNTFK